MADGLRADPQSGMGPQFLHAAQPQLSISEEDIMRRAVWRAQVDKFVEIVLNARLAQNRRRYHAAWQAADHQTVTAGAAIDMVGGLRAARSRHEFDDHSGIA